MGAVLVFGIGAQPGAPVTRRLDGGEGGGGNGGGDQCLTHGALRVSSLAALNRVWATSIVYMVEPAFGVRHQGRLVRAED